jgi:hypothetical protein
MTKLEKLLWKVNEHAENEQWGKAATILEKEADGEGARAYVAGYLLDELNGDPDSLLEALNNLLEGAHR